MGGKESLGESNNGNKYILTIVDVFTKFGVAVPIPDQRVETVVHAFLSRWILIFGPPFRLHTDQGTNFEYTCVSNMCN